MQKWNNITMWEEQRSKITCLLSQKGTKREGGWTRPFKKQINQALSRSWHSSSRFRACTRCSWGCAPCCGQSAEGDGPGRWACPPNLPTLAASSQISSGERLSTIWQRSVCWLEAGILLTVGPWMSKTSKVWTWLQHNLVVRREAFGTAFQRRPMLHPRGPPKIPVLLVDVLFPCQLFPDPGVCWWPSWRAPLSAGWCNGGGSLCPRWNATIEHTKPVLILL